MSVAWGNFEDMARWYLRCVGGLEDRGVVLFERPETGAYGVCTGPEYAQLLGTERQGMFRLVMSMTAEEFIGLMLVRVLDIVEVATSGDDEESVQAGDKSRDLLAPVDAGTDQERKGGDAGSGSEAGETYKADAESAEPGAGQK